MCSRNAAASLGPRPGCSAPWSRVRRGLRMGAGVCGAPSAWEGWEQTPARVRSAATRAQRTRRPAEAAPRPMRLASMDGGGMREAAPTSPGRVTYCAPGSLEARPPERCVGWLNPTGRRGRQRLRRAGDRERVFPRERLWCVLCWRWERARTRFCKVRSRSPPGLASTVPSYHPCSPGSACLRTSSVTWHRRSGILRAWLWHRH